MVKRAIGGIRSFKYVENNVDNYQHILNFKYFNIENYLLFYLFYFRYNGENFKFSNFKLWVSYLNIRIPRILDVGVKIICIFSLFYFSHNGGSFKFPILRFFLFHPNIRISCLNVIVYQNFSHTFPISLFYFQFSSGNDKFSNFQLLSFFLSHPIIGIPSLNDIWWILCQVGPYFFYVFRSISQQLPSIFCTSGFENNSTVGALFVDNRADWFSLRSL